MGLVITFHNIIQFHCIFLINATLVSIIDFFQKTSPTFKICVTLNLTCVWYSFLIFNSWLGWLCFVRMVLFRNRISSLMATGANYNGKSFMQKQTNGWQSTGGVTERSQLQTVWDKSLLAILTHIIQSCTQHAWNLLNLVHLRDITETRSQWMNKESHGVVSVSIFCNSVLNVMPIMQWIIILYGLL